MNQADFLALMRTDLKAVGIEPDRYFGLNTWVPLSFTRVRAGPFRPYSALLSDWLSKCPYRPELTSRLYEFALATEQDHSSLGNLVISQVLHQSATRRIMPEKFFKQIFRAKDAKDFMTRLLCW